MIYHPHVYHAEVALWRLQLARAELVAATAAEHRQRLVDARTVAAARDLQAWRPMVGHGGGGGYGDPVLRTVVDVDEASGDGGRLERLGRSIHGTLAWLADGVRAGVVGSDLDPLDRLRLRLFDLRAWHAAQLALWFAEADERIRKVVPLDDGEVPVPGLACPACGVRRLVGVTIGPMATIVRARGPFGVVCRAGCSCAGASCPCGMEVRAEGVPHIWPLLSRLNRQAAEVLAG